MIDTAKTCPAVDEGFISAPPGHGAGKDAHKCEACSLYFTSAQALDGHRATSREHQDNLARIEGGAIQEGANPALPAKLSSPEGFADQSNLSGPLQPGPKSIQG